VTPSRGCRPNESLNIFEAEFSRTLDKLSLGKAERVRVVTTMTLKTEGVGVEKGHQFLGKKVTLSVTAPGDTNLSDATKCY